MRAMAKCMCCLHGGAAYQQAPCLSIFWPGTCQLAQEILGSFEVPQLCIADTSALQSLKVGSIARHLGLVSLRLLCQLSFLLCTQLPGLRIRRNLSGKVLTRKDCMGVHGKEDVTDIDYAAR